MSRALERVVHALTSRAMATETSHARARRARMRVVDASSDRAMDDVGDDARESEDVGDHERRDGGTTTSGATSGNARRRTARTETLKRVLTRNDLTTLGVGGIIGAGVFVLTGAVAHDHAGPAVVVSYAVAAFASSITGLAYAEFAVAMPVAGSAYNYMMNTFGELAAFLTGANLALELTIASAAVARGWTSYAVALFGRAPNSARIIVWRDVVEIDFIAGFVVAGMTALLVSGAKETAKFSAAVTVVSLIAIATVIVVGSTVVDTENWSPFAPNGLGGIISGASVVIFAFVGFDTIATCAEEVANPSADLPFGILVSLGICATLYALMCLVITGMEPYTKIDVHAPFALAFQSNNLQWVSSVVSVGAIAAITSSLLLSMMGQPRIFMVMARDGLLPAWFSDVSKRFGTPANATLFSGAITGVLGMLLDINLLAQLVSIGTLSIFCGVNLGLIVSRVTPKHAEWAQRAPALRRAAALLISSLTFAIDFRARDASLSWLGGAALIAAFASSASFLTLPAVNLPLTFKMPFVPFLPAFGVVLTCVLIAGLGVVAIVRYVVYSTLCFIGYVFFAVRRYNAEKRALNAARFPGVELPALELPGDRPRALRAVSDDDFASSSSDEDRRGQHRRLLSSPNIHFRV